MLLRSELVVAFAFLYALSLAERASDVPKSMITPAPELRRRQTIEPYGSRSDFIGYYVLGSAYSASYCSGSRYSEHYVTASRNWFGGCWYARTYSAFTSCYAEGRSAYGIASYTSNSYTSTFYTSRYCTYGCISNYMVYRFDALFTSYFVECAYSGWDTDTLYRMSSTSLTYPVRSGARLTTSSSSEPPSTPPIPPTTIPSTIPTPVPPAGGATVVPSPIEKPKGLLIGPIIGGVIGGLAVIAVAAVVGIWLCLKKRRRTNDAPVHQTFQTQLPQHQQGYGPYSAQEKIPVSASISPISPSVEQQQQRASSPPSMSPRGSPSPPIYHPQPIPRPYSHQQPPQQVHTQQRPTQLP